MSRNLTIDVNVNPNAQPKPTEAKVTTTRESSEISSRTTNNIVSTTLIISLARRAASVAASNIGELTGSKTLQRKSQAIGSIAALGIATINNPLTAGIALSFQIGQQAIVAGIENRNIANQANYNRILRTATYNNGRK
jgi:hypothetical protein